MAGSLRCPVARYSRTVRSQYQTIQRHYYRWLDAGIIDAIFRTLIQDVDTEWIQIDSTVIKAHKQAVGASLEKVGNPPSVWANVWAAQEAVSRQTPVSDGLGLPLRFEVGAGQARDMK